MIDVAVVGGGPVGLAAALALRRRGLSVCVLEARTPPLDKACGEGLMPDGVARLEALGVALDGVRSRPFRGIRYVDGEVEAEADFPGRPGLGLRRTVLHEAMARAAGACGVELAWGERVRGLTPGGVETDGGEVAARWIVGADGLRSRVCEWAGLGRRRSPVEEAPPQRRSATSGDARSERRPGRDRRRFGVRRHYRVEPWGDRVEVHWADGCEAYVTPVAADEVGVAFLWSGASADFDDLLARFPALAARLAGREATSRDRGAGPLDQRPRGLVRGRVLLVGDAAGYRDAITGEGLSLGFRQAELLAAALAAGRPRAYERAARRAARVPFALIAGLLWVERRPRRRRRLVATLSADPALFARLLAVHAGERPPRSIGLAGAASLLRGLLGRAA